MCAILHLQTDPQFHRMQQLLREQEIVMLPDNGGLLMPVLGPGKKLVGLLMVERLAEPDEAAVVNSFNVPVRAPALQKAADGEFSSQCPPAINVTRILHKAATWRSKSIWS